MIYEKINHFTWVLAGAKGKTKERFGTLKVSAPLETLEKKAVKPTQLRTNEYRKFCKEIFKQRKFICLKDFRKKIKTEIHPNTTWYIRRMENLKFIKIINNVIKPGDEL